VTESSYAAWLEGISPGIEGKLFEVGPGGIRLGRSASCSIPIVDPMVSREHAEVRFLAGGYVIVDLGSSHGTWVDGQQVSEASLRPGARIRLGSSEFVFHMPQEAIPTAIVAGQPTVREASPIPARPVSGPSASGAPGAALPGARPAEFLRSIAASHHRRSEAGASAPLTPLLGCPIMPACALD
jgi:predicted component of type VI protein secretion system